MDLHLMWILNSFCPLIDDLPLYIPTWPSLQLLPSLLVSVHGSMSAICLYLTWSFNMSCDLLLFIHDTVMNE